MAKTIIINESSFNRLLEYVGDEEEFGRYDLEDVDVPSREDMSIFNKTNGETNMEGEMTDSDWEENQYIGADFNDPGPYKDNGYKVGV
jgi:predicted glycosyltransferase involved in capsule biosynthesis